MPHKRNPITAEQICGLARVVRANSQAALENVALWHERDISHSSVERVILPDSTILTDYLLAKTADLVEKLVVYPARMQKNLDSTGGLIFSGQLLLDLAEAGMLREDAYRLVQKHAMNAWQNDLVFRDLVSADAEIAQLLSAEKLARTFDLQRQLGNVDAIFARVLGSRAQSTERRAQGRAMNVTVAVTGASGAIFGRALLRALDADARVSRIHFVPSENSLRVLAEELGISGRNDLAEKLLGRKSAKITQHAESDVGAAIASGSYPSDGMIVLPCSMGTLAGIANGMAGKLDRAGRGCLPEGAAAADFVRAGDAVQQDSHSQYGPGGGCGRDNFSGDSGVLCGTGRRCGDGEEFCRPGAGACRAAAGGCLRLEG